MTDSTDTVADSPDSPDSPDASDSPDATDATDAAAPDRSAATDQLWEEVRVDPIKVALPGGTVGYTLRAYRPATELTPTEAPEPEPEDELFAARERERTEQEAALAGATEAAALGGVAAETEPSGSEEAEAGEEPAPEEFRDDADAEPDELAEEGEEAEEDLPVFLSHRGKLLLFGSAESLVSFITSDAPHDLAQLDTWPTVVKRVRPADITPTDEDTYELDLVVENLRGGHDAWDLRLLISAGELTRDLGWALRLTPVITALSAGSPLDDLDEALRAAEGGGFGGMFARRRLRRIGAQQASLGWRTAIGKITGAVDWRD